MAKSSTTKRQRPRNWSSRRGQGLTADWLRQRTGYDGVDCLIWPFTRTQAGYGQFGLNGRLLGAHRYMCELVNGPPPTPKHEAAHSCGRGHDGCVHPKHLSWKTRAENLADRYVHGTIPKRPQRWMLTAAQVVHIRALRPSKTIMELATMFNTSRRNVQHILKGNTWVDGVQRGGVNRLTAP